MNDTVKVAALKHLLEDEKLLGELLEQVDVTEKQADAMGIAFKEFDPEPDLLTLSPDDLLDYAIAFKEAEIAQEKAEKAKKQDDEDDEDENEGASPGQDYMRTMKGYLKQMGGYVEKMGSYVEKMHGDKKHKDDTVAALNDAADSQTERMGVIETTIKELSGKLALATAELVALKGDQPPATHPEGTRPTENGANIVTNPEKPVKIEAEKAMGQQGHMDGFMDYITGDGEGAS